jgi:hypothetical protein
MHRIELSAGGQKKRCIATAKDGQLALLKSSVALKAEKPGHQMQLINVAAHKVLARVSGT